MLLWCLAGKHRQQGLLLSGSRLWISARDEFESCSKHGPGSESSWRHKQKAMAKDKSGHETASLF